MSFEMNRNCNIAWSNFSMRCSHSVFTRAATRSKYLQKLSISSSSSTDILSSESNSFIFQSNPQKYYFGFSRRRFHSFTRSVIRSHLSITPPITMALSATDSSSLSPSTNQNELLEHVHNIIPPLDPSKYKGQAGKIAVIGGCKEYTGAPYFAAYSALKAGADLSHVFCTSGAATVIKTYSPELIVHPYLIESSSEGSDKAPETAVKSIAPWLDKFNVIVIGPGLGRDPIILDTIKHVYKEAQQRGIPLVIDADGLWILNDDVELVQGYTKAILTPNAAEFRRLCDKVGVNESRPDAVKEIAKALGGVTVVRKGRQDEISDGTEVYACAEQGSPRRAGGQGDVLSGTIATFVAWALLASPSSEKRFISRNPLMIAAYGGCLVTRMASQRAFQKHGRSMGATNLIPELGAIVDSL